MSAYVDSFLNSAAQGEADAKKVTDFVEQDTTGNGFPGFTSIFNKVWGVAQGIINPQPTLASNNLKSQPAMSNGEATGLALVGVGLLAFVVMNKGRKSPRRAYARMRRGRK